MTILFYLSSAILIYFAALAIWYAFTLVLAFPDIIKTYRISKYGQIDQLMRDCTIPITVIIPAYNEEKRILNCIYSVLQSDYKHTRIIVVSDGSTDKTIALLKKTFSLYPIPPAFNQAIRTSAIQQYYRSETHENLMLIDKAHSPENNAADANNAGLNAATTPLVMTLDADTVLSPEAITNMIFSFLSNEHCISVGGTVYLSNDNEIAHGRMLTKNVPKTWITAFQFLEYFRSFTYGRAGLNIVSGALCYSGAFTLFETNALREFGGFDKENFSYDSEIILRFHHKMKALHYPTAVYFNAYASAWTWVPDTLRSYWNQRNKWQRGLLMSILKHKSMLFNPKYGFEGMLTFPCYVFFEVFGPVVEFISYLLLLISLLFYGISWPIIGWFLFLAWAYLAALTAGTMYLNLISSNIFSRSFTMLYSLMIITVEMFGFRQFRAACCFYSTCQFIVNRLLGRKL